MRKPIGLAITVNGLEKFVGKVTDFKDLQGRTWRVLYREADFIEFFCFKEQAISIDKQAADYALSILGAQWMICYCQDTHEIYDVPTSSFNHAVVSDLGELPQYRIPIESCRKFRNVNPLAVEYTDFVIKL